MAGAPAIAAGVLTLITSLAYFSGQIPPPLSSFSGDPDLPGNPSRRLLSLAPNPSPSHRSVAFPPIPPPIRKHKHKHKIRDWIIGFLVGATTGTLGGFLVSTLFHLLLNHIRGLRSRRDGTQIFSPLIKSKDELAFLTRDDGLSDLQIIGRGGSGEVYLKLLPAAAGPRPIAIKRIRKHSVPSAAGSLTEEESRLLDKWTRQIRSEIRTVSKIRHRNLLPLLAHVARPDCHYLVYEYMKHGSLHDAIRDSGLSWPARHRVALGIAAGLEHLHLHHHPRVIHRDLKPDNVLLDEGLEARISDFGFAKEMPESATHVTMSNVAGTVGYIAPEYYQTMKYTAKCDVYSFGVLLGVIVMGRFPSDEFFLETEEMGLVKWMRNQVRAGNSKACFDAKIGGGEEDEEMELMLRVACFCTADDPLERPNSKDVRVMLAQINHTYVGL